MNKDFESYVINERNAFVNAITKWFPHEIIPPNSEGKLRRTEIRVASESILIAYDQLRQQLTACQEENKRLKNAIGAIKP